MITTLDKLQAKLAAMRREHLEDLAHNVVLSLYGTVYCPEDELCTPEEAAALGIKEDDIIINSDKEWSGGDVCESVAQDLEHVGLNPTQL